MPDRSPDRALLWGEISTHRHQHGSASELFAVPCHAGPPGDGGCTGTADWQSARNLV